MDELEISGKRYLSSRRAAKDHRYNPDYIGQLIRGGKVPGTKVGRAWYVDAEALAVYLGKEPAPAQMVSAEPQEAPALEPEVEVLAPEVVEAAEVEAKGAQTIAQAEVAAMVEAQHIEEVEEKKAEKIEEARHIPVHIAAAPQLEPESIAEIRRPLKHKTTGLVYIADERPLFPAIKKSEIRLPGMHAAPQVEREVEHVVIKPHARPRRRVSPGAVLGVVLAGAVVFGGVLFLSTRVTERIEVVDGQPASAAFSFK